MLSTHHAVKSCPDQFRLARDGIKQFEVRKNDRGYKVGDILILQEWDNEKKHFTSNAISCRIEFILQGEFGLPKDLAVLQIKVL